MTGTLAALVFIGAAGVAGIYTATKPTVIDGKVIAADLLNRSKAKGINSVDCDPKIPVTTAGAVFTCKLTRSDGASARLKFRMNRAGSYKGEDTLEESGPTREPPPRARKGWDE